MTRNHTPSAPVSPPTVTLKTEKRGEERPRKHSQPRTGRPSAAPGHPLSTRGPAAGSHRPGRRGEGPAAPSPWPAMGCRPGGGEPGGDRRSRRRPEAPDPARWRGARRGRPSPRAAARRRVAGRCPARLLSHSALSHSLAVFLRAGALGSNIRASPPEERRN